jgi:uncharacterized protein
MYIDMGWVETDFESMVVGYAIFYGGLMQLIVAIFELIRGATFPFAVFGSYAAFWLGWAKVILETHDTTLKLGTDFSDGKTAWLIQWGVLTFGFWVIALRKNYCLIATLGLLWITFFLLAAATHTGDPDVKKSAGYFGFFTAIAAWYTAMAEIANEEFGWHVLPGLRPILSPERFQITKASIVKRTQYDGKTNTMFLQFRGMQIKSDKDVLNIKLGLEEAFKNSKAPGDGKVHVVVDYEDVLISDELFAPYWSMVAELERTWYLSAKRFHVTSFGTSTAGVGGDPIGMRKVADNWAGSATHCSEDHPHLISHGHEQANC